MAPCPRRQQQDAAYQLFTHFVLRLALVSIAKDLFTFLLGFLHHPRTSASRQYCLKEATINVQENPTCFLSPSARSIQMFCRGAGEGVAA